MLMWVLPVACIEVVPVVRDLIGRGNVHCHMLVLPAM